MVWLTAGALVLVTVLPPVVNLLANTATYLPKSGRVVDETTNKGMKDVFIIATANYGGMGTLTGGYGDSLYRIVTRTNEEGEYRIPNTWSHAHIWFPAFVGTQPHTDWRISAFKPGYAVAGDEPARVSFDKYGIPKQWPHSVEYPTSAHLGLGEIKVDPIMMQPVELDLKREAVYYDMITSAQRRRLGTENKPEELELRKVCLKTLLPRLCSFDHFQ